MFTNNAKLQSTVTKAIKNMNSAKALVQVACMGIAFQVMENKNTEQLTRLVMGLSGHEGEGTVLLSTDAKQVGRYMIAMLPIRWDKELQRFKVETNKHKDHDWTAAYEAMNSCRWDAFGKEKADNAFNEEKEWKKIVAAVKRIHENADKDSTIRKNADVIIRSFGLAA